MTTQTSDEFTLLKVSFLEKGFSPPGIQAVNTKAGGST
jgi:hypothetical protein